MLACGAVVVVVVVVVVLNVVVVEDDEDEEDEGPSLFRFVVRFVGMQHAVFSLVVKPKPKPITARAATTGERSESCWTFVVKREDMDRRRGSFWSI